MKLDLNSANPLSSCSTLISISEFSFSLKKQVCSDRGVCIVLQRTVHELREQVISVAGSVVRIGSLVIAGLR